MLIIYIKEMGLITLTCIEEFLQANNIKTQEDLDRYTKNYKPVNLSLFLLKPKEPFTYQCKDKNDKDKKADK